MTAGKIKVVIAGVNGRLGRASARLIGNDPNFELVGAFGRPGAAYVGKQIGQVTCLTNSDIVVKSGLKEVLEAAPSGAKPDVLLDWTQADPAYEHAKQALNLGVRPVIGTSGLAEQHVQSLSQLAGSKRLGALIVPNFSLGAVLMMEFARQAGTFFTNVEIVEMHHTKKVDAPSGTAMHTASQLANAHSNFNVKEVEEHEKLSGARGGKTPAGVRIHSLRLPGLISHQEVIFGAEGELLTIKHDSYNTDCFSKGILMALTAVMQMENLVVGLDKVLSINNNKEHLSK